MIMKSILVLLFMICFQDLEAYKIFNRGMGRDGALGAPDFSEAVEVPDEWFDQKLDHFQPLVKDIWKQRYFKNSEMYKPGGPVFLMIGGKEAINPAWMKTGAWIEYAKRFDAMCFMLEHRFYGKSRPKESLSTDNIGLLNHEMGLADAANFISKMTVKLNLQPGTKWVLFGGSHAGAMAAWIRMSYPHLAYAAVSSSGPLLAKSNFEEYHDIVAQSLETFGGKPCVSAIQEATTQMENMLAQKEDLKELFRLCDNVDPENQKDISNLYEVLASNIGGVVQYNKDNRKFEGIKGSALTIDQVCSVLTNENTGSPVQRYAAANSLILDTFGEQCLDFKYDKMIEYFKQEGWESEAAAGARQWAYQTCNEMGFFQTSDHKPQIFGHNFPEDFFIQKCNDTFGHRFTKEFMERATDNINLHYGDKSIKVSRVVFVHGSVDPWHVLGITSSENKDSPAIYINGTAHCADMYPSLETDPQDLKDARRKIEELIAKWLEK